MNDVARRLADNLAQIQGRISAAAVRSGRMADAVRLVAVTKHVPAEFVAQLVAAGCMDLGESRPQELWAKAEQLNNPAIRWHMIGHMQRNKIRRTLPYLHLIHSVDSRRVLAALDEEAALVGQKIGVLLELNVTSDVTKTGLPPSEVESLLEKASELQHVSIRGLMAMASHGGSETAARRDFARLRTIRDRLAKKSPQGAALSELSMGMSGDFEIAILEGATIVRVGSALFEGIET